MDEESSLVRLSYREKVPVSVMKDIIKSCLVEKLNSITYDNDRCDEAVKYLSSEIRSRLKLLGYSRYKYVVNVTIGERREQGIRLGTRCFWDSNTDNMASDTYMNDHIFCSATVFAAYMY